MPRFSTRFHRVTQRRQKYTRHADKREERVPRFTAVESSLVKRCRVSATLGQHRGRLERAPVISPHTRDTCCRLTTSRTKVARPKNRERRRRRRRTTTNVSRRINRGPFSKEGRRGIVRVRGFVFYDGEKKVARETNEFDSSRLLESLKPRGMRGNGAFSLSLSNVFVRHVDSGGAVALNRRLSR